MSTSLLDTCTAYLQELREFFESRHIATGCQDDVPLFLEQLNSTELQEETGCLLRSIVFREEGEVAASWLLQLLVAAVGGHEEHLAGSTSPAILDRLLAFVVQETKSLGVIAHPQAPCDLPREAAIGPEKDDPPSDVPKHSGHAQPAYPGPLAFLQRFYWLPAGALSLLAIALCIYLPRGLAQKQGTPATINAQVPLKKPHTPHKPATGSTGRTTAPFRPVVHPPVTRTPPIPASRRPVSQHLYTRSPASEVLLSSSGLIASHLLYAPAPAYPASAKASHLQGSVLLRLLIDRAGTVAAAQILRGSAPFAAVAQRTISHWRYRPFVTDGTAEIATLVTVTFRLAA